MSREPLYVLMKECHRSESGLHVPFAPMARVSCSFQESNVYTQTCDLEAAHQQKSFSVADVRDREREHHKEVTLLKRDLEQTRFQLLNFCRPNWQHLIEVGLLSEKRNKLRDELKETLSRFCNTRKVGDNPRSGQDDPRAARGPRREAQIAPHSSVKPGLQRLSGGAAHARSEGFDFKTVDVFTRTPEISRILILPVVRSPATSL